MTILIFGRDGQLGSCLVNKLNQEKINYVAFSKKEVDITNNDLVKFIIKKNKPTTVINAAAYTLVKESENNKKKAFDVNQYGVKNIAVACKNADCNLIHISTDYVFDGTSCKPYTPEMNTNPINVYGKSKLKGEHELIKHGGKFIILRTSWVFSEYGKNFVKTMIQIANKKRNINVVNDQTGTPTYAGDISEVILNLNTKFDDDKVQEIYHYAGSPLCTWYDFAKTLFQILLEKKLISKMPILIPTPSSDYYDGLKRPTYSALCSKKYIQEFKVCETDWRDSLKNITVKL
tara:strand:+ start:687 stop:1556 length:870 start_codon:yes stop_codon:yes gene_type:complete